MDWARVYKNTLSCLESELSSSSFDMAYDYIIGKNPKGLRNLLETGDIGSSTADLIKDAREAFLKIEERRHAEP